MTHNAIYRPRGSAAEYAPYACGFYNSCSNGCTYCFLRKGVLSHVMGGSTPTLKKCFKNEEHAMEIFRNEMLKNLDELEKHGLFFTFTSDPMLPETINLTMAAINALVINEIPVKILTKRADWVDSFLSKNGPIVCNGKAVHNVAFGFSITGRDDLEPGASTNAERQDAGRKLHNAGFKTFGSFEPIVDLDSTYEQIIQALDWCDLFKIGLMSGQKIDEDFRHKLIGFVGNVLLRCEGKIYFKDSITKITGSIKNSFFGVETSHCVDRDFNLFE